MRSAIGAFAHVLRACETPPQAINQKNAASLVTATAATPAGELYGAAPWPCRGAARRQALVGPGRGERQRLSRYRAIAYRCKLGLRSFRPGAAP